ncbi:ABC transporter [Microbacterium sp. CFBP 8790]|uniref:ABC transporter n=1 Tax=unclassified Microbacterium TaxID=2609290 RepID=UPI00177E969C|nr:MULTISPECIES: ABC transporter [unclassified Microbacterium]MBD8206517.1 ABC transporter [Microbacterium sp. CFBP 8801]MBD8510152.1 ABC transporter [Microbacterium sp. CFBP 8790]
MPHPDFPRRLAPLSVVLLLSLAGCAAPAAAPDTAPSTDTHGEIAGAAELAEPAVGLTSIDGDGRVSHLDLLDETTTTLGTVRPPSAVHSDGRYLFAADDTGVSIVDSGVWTWDHVDHFHYYRADARLLGDVEGEGTAVVATSNSSTTGGTGLFFPGSGEAVLLDTEALSRGEVVERFRLSTSPGAGLVVPAGSLAAVAADDEVTLHDADGAEVGEPAACIQPAGTITTRVGAVIGCQDGALLISVDDDAPVVERIAYPAGTTAPRATAFANREGRPKVAAVAGDAGVWILDTRERTWTLLPTPEPVVQVTAVDDKDANLLALTPDGRVLVLDGETGAQRAASPALVGASLAAGQTVSLVADQQRAYLNGPTESRMWEIDFADAARVAREFTPERAPLFFAETGR